MPQNITPGSQITVKVVKQPTNLAATKTLVRVLSKDPAVKAENDRLARVRVSKETHSPRGGRWRVWESRHPKVHPVKGRIGDSGTLVASLDVIRDLQSVSRFVEVASA